MPWYHYRLTNLLCAKIWLQRFWNSYRTIRLLI
jgi:hypothetical protein